MKNIPRQISGQLILFVRLGCGKPDPLDIWYIHDTDSDEYFECQISYDRYKSLSVIYYRGQGHDAGEKFMQECLHGAESAQRERDAEIRKPMSCISLDTDRFAWLTDKSGSGKMMRCHDINDHAWFETPYVIPEIDDAIKGDTPDIIDI